MPRILVADDNTNIQKMVALAFEERGINVVSVGNGEAAVRRIPDMNPDLVLADVFMPVRNGYEVCEFVKKDERFAHVPVILLVGAFDPLDEKEARRVGADGVLKKPFVPPDPLIAMVTSALEKNPKLAAELAKAKETPKEPELPPMPIMEAPTKREPAPLPDFPEPTPEEAAQIYGFGKGVRGIGDENQKEGKAPVNAHNEAEEKEDFEDAASGRDWRRSGMDLEIPEGASSGFVASFSPENQSPAMRSAAQELEQANREEDARQPSTSNSDASPAFLAAIQAAKRDEVPAVEEEADDIPAASFSDEPVVSSGSVFNPMAGSQSVPEAQFADEPAKFVLPSQSSAQPAAQATEAEPEPVASEPESPQRAAHWMDMMSPSSTAKYSTVGWSTQLAEEQETAQKEAQAPLEVPPPVSVSASKTQSWQEAPTAPVHFPAVQAEPEPAPEPVSASASASTRVEPEADSFFADEPQPEPHAAAPKSESWFSVPPPVHDVPVSPDVEDKVREIIEQVSAQQRDSRPAPDFGHEIVLPHHEESNGSHEHVTAEAELVQTSSPLESVFSNEPAPGTRVQPPSFSSGRDSGGSYHFQEPEHERAFEPEADSSAPEPPSQFASQESESESAIFSEERIPTSYPPNREALAEIPFLQPPPPEPPKPSTEAVDTVVARVLEKLEPQLHELLSKGVLKPLVENLLQEELEKKSK